MSDDKRIDLQKHVSPRAPKSYLIRIVIYAALIAGCIFLIYFMQDRSVKTQKKPDPNKVKEIRNFTIDTVNQNEQ